MQSDKQLQHWYWKYNKLYWKGELPENTVLIWEPPVRAEADTCPVFEVADGCFEIKVDPALKGVPCYWKLTLLHEMIHVAKWRQHPKHQHGKIFKDEKRRLYDLGALDKIW